MRIEVEEGAALTVEDLIELGLTRAERKIVRALMDGKPHLIREELAMLWDEQGSVANVFNHVSRANKKLAPTGLVIIHRRLHNRKAAYQLFRSFDDAVNSIVKAALTEVGLLPK